MKEGNRPRWIVPLYIINCFDLNEPPFCIVQLCISVIDVLEYL